MVFTTPLPHDSTTPMNAIILFSHGSVLCGGGKHLFQLARRLEARRAAPIVEVGYLNYSEPPFEAAFEKCVARGATEIVVAPYFLVAGYFVKSSLPPKIEAMRERFPSVKVRVAEAIRDDEIVADALVSCADRAQEPGRWRDLLADAPRFCRNSPRCPLFDANECPRLHQMAVEAGRREQDAPPEPLSAFRGEFELPVDLVERVKTLQNAPLELALDELLCGRHLGVKFQSRRPMGRFLADFYAPDSRLIVQIMRDGQIYESKERIFYVSETQWRSDAVQVVTSIARALENEALLVMVHGSPRPESNQDMFAVVERLRHRNAFSFVEVGFMECNEPSIPEAIDTLAAQGAKKIIAVPYFLHSGTHVADDLPTLLEAAGQKYPRITFSMGDYLGRDPLMDEVIVKRVEEAS